MVVLLVSACGLFGIHRCRDGAMRELNVVDRWCGLGISDGSDWSGVGENVGGGM